MPFVDATRPSIQLGLLCAVGRDAGFHVSTLHAGIDLAAAVGPDLYAALCEHRGHLLGDWLFSVEAFREEAPDQGTAFLDDFAEELGYLGGTPAERRQRLLDLRHRIIPMYLEALLREPAWDDVDVVGFTCTFQQNAASFALARRLKERLPHLVTLFGGANFEGEMGRELVRSVDCVDLAVDSEGDAAFPMVLRALQEGSDPGDVPGVVRRDGRGGVYATPPAPPSTGLDDLPMPDYDEFFERAARHGFVAWSGYRDTVIPFESARGCWWGAKHHCTFCGLNGTTITWRSKSSARVRAELQEQTRRYRTFSFSAVDNILDMRYISTLMPDLAAAETGYELFYEVKANLSREQVRALALGGVRQVQPGIESLSTHVLRLMRKGVTAAQNINVLRWLQYYGVSVSWNVLWGFPGETEQDYAVQVAAVPHLVHLQPPQSIGRVWLERFSPMFTEPGLLPARVRTPEASYRYVYPTAVDLQRAAYFFDYEADFVLPQGSYSALADAVGSWKAAWSGEVLPELVFRASPGLVQVYDTRWPGDEGTYTYEGVLADLYVACSGRPMTAHTLRKRLEARLSEAEIEEVLADWHSRGLVFRDGPTALALALPAGPLR